MSILTRPSDTHYPAIQLTINSLHATSNSNNETSDCYFSLAAPISAPTPLVDALIALTSVSIPRTWSDVNIHNNQLVFSWYNQDVELIPPTLIEIPPGIYTAREFANELLTTMADIGATTLNLRYNAITNHFIFDPGVNRKLVLYEDGTTMNTLIGIDFIDDLMESTPLLESNKGIDLSGTRYIQFETNLPTSNLDSSNGFSSSKSLDTIPVNVSPYGIITYNFVSPNWVRVANFHMEWLGVRLLDDNGLLLLMNGGRWTAVINIQYQYRPIQYVDENPEMLSNQGAMK